METMDKVGEVKRTPLGAWKKICEECSLTTIIAGKARKMDELWKRACEKSKGKGQTYKDSEVSLFTQSTIDSICGEIKQQRTNEGIEER